MHDKLDGERDQSNTYLQPSVMRGKTLDDLLRESENALTNEKKYWFDYFTYNFHCNPFITGKSVIDDIKSVIDVEGGHKDKKEEHTCAALLGRRRPKLNMMEGFIIIILFSVIYNNL